MNKRQIVLTSILLVLTIFLGWYIGFYRPSADELASETIEQVEGQAALTGSGDNPASLEEIRIESDGTIKLAPEDN
ncbi:MAG: hypothetical protein AAB647_03705 [Patescibacteria group bacterium]